MFWRNPQRPYARPLELAFQGEDMVHPLWRHRESMNYNGPKVIYVALVKSGHMLETLSISHYRFQS